jgi:hypothetical protein
MEKDESITYPSLSILGKLYREVVEKVKDPFLSQLEEGNFIIKSNLIITNNKFMIKQFLFNKII